MTVPNTFTSGVDTTFSTKLNENFEALDYDLVASNTTSTTISSSTSTTTQVCSVAVAASAIKQYVEIKVDFNAVAYVSGNPPAGSGTVSVQLLAGTTGAEAVLVTRELSRCTANGSGWNATHENACGGTYSYYYAPSTAEKNAGFNVILKCVTVGSGGSSSYNHYSLRVFGR